ncbi:MAG TPA: DUF4190 domain-containing protein [Tepidisphaeraceae bacterium]|nr:DUF4190 domain-containing protein [Tepidisphaeraceae bacterium]
MSQAPPAYAPPPPPPVSKNNGWAIASLIFGIIGCIPFLSGILAVIFGIVGIKKSPQSGGKGLAITGLILGILSFLGWAGFVTVGGLGTLAMYRASAQPRAVAKQFAQDLSAGNVDAALGRCDPAMKRENVQNASDMLQQLGAIKNTVVFGVNGPSSDGSTQWQIVGSVVFDKGTKKYTAALNKIGADYKIVKFEFQ